MPGEIPCPDRTQDLQAWEQDRVLRFASLAPGSLFAERYRVHERCGSGGTGEVFRATDELANLEVGLKVLFPASGRLRIERLRREVRILRTLEHPSVVKVHDIGEHEGLFFLVMDYLEGETLRERLVRQGPLPAEEARVFLCQVLDALSVAHAAGVVHRDLKPGNILLTRDRAVDNCSTGQRAVLLDFGLARGTSDATVTRSGGFVGTPIYMAPEQLTGRDVDPRADLYSLGIVLWEMLAGVPTFHTESTSDLIEAHVRTPVPRIPEAVLAAGPWAADLVLWLLQKDRAQRPSSAEQVLETLAHGGWGQRLGRRLRLRGASRARVRRPFVVAGLASILAALLWWYPVSIRGGTGEVRSTNVFGGTVARHSVPFGLRDYVLVPGTYMNPELIGTGHFPGWKGMQAPYDNGMFRVRGWGRRLEPFRLRGDVWPDLPTQFPHYDGHYQPGTIDVLPWTSLGQPLLAVTYNHRHFPSLALLITPDGRVRTEINHPGSMNGQPQVVATDRGELVVFSAINNLVGGRGVVFGVAHPSLSLFGGRLSVPPYISKDFLTGDVLWYTFLKERPGPNIAVAAGKVVATFGKTQVALHSENGVPGSPVDRDGLSEEEWLAAQESLLEAMKKAALQLRSNRPELGGRLLAEFAHATAADKVQKGVALHGAAQMYRTAGHLETALELGIEGEAVDTMAQGHLRTQIDVLARLGDLDRLVQRVFEFKSEPTEANEVQRDLLMAYLLANRPDLVDTLVFSSGYYIEYTRNLTLLHMGRVDEAARVLSMRTERSSPDLSFLEATARALQGDAEGALDALELAEEGQGDGYALPFALLRMFIAANDGASADRATVLAQLEVQRAAAKGSIVDLYYLGWSERLAETLIGAVDRPTRPDLRRAVDSFNRSLLAGRMRLVQNPR